MNVLRVKPPFPCSYLFSLRWPPHVRIYVWMALIFRYGNVISSIRNDEMTRIITKIYSPTRPSRYPKHCLFSHYVALNKNARSLTTTIQFLCSFTWVAFIWLSMVALSTGFSQSFWLDVENFPPIRNGWKSFHGEQNRGDHIEEHEKHVLETRDKSDLVFCSGPAIKKTKSVKAS